jgi:hypothetical protein
MVSLERCMAVSVSELGVVQDVKLDREHQSGDRQLVLQMLSHSQNDLVVRAARLKGAQFGPELAKRASEASEQWLGASCGL